MLKATPIVLQFGTVFVGATSKAKNLTRINAKNSKQNIAITVSSIKPSTQEFAAAKNCVGQIAPGIPCKVAITFSPAGAGHRKATLVVASKETNPSL